MNFDLKSLMCFKKVAELEHMTKAAAELYISQAQLSRIITDLENQFSAKFFDRVGTGIKLNACGKEFYNYTQKVFALTEKSAQRISSVYKREQFQLSIVSNSGAFMPGVTTSILNEFPELNFYQITADRKKCLASLREGSADFSIYCSIPNGGDLNKKILMKETGVVIYPEGHWLSERKSVSINELANERFVGTLRDFGAREAMEAAFKRCSITPEFVVETMESGLITDFVRSGVGIAVVPKSLCMMDSCFKDRYCEIEEPLMGSVCLLWMKDRVLNDMDKHFIDIVSEYFSDLYNRENQEKTQK